MNRLSTAPGPATLIEQLATWTAALRFDDIPDRVRDVAVSQVISHLATVRAGARHPLGGKLLTAFGPRAGDGPGRNTPDRTAYLLSGLSSCMYLEDTLYSGHVSHSSVGVPVAYQRQQGLTGRDLITAVVAANESSARVTAAATLGQFRGQTAAHTHLIGAAAARLHGCDADADTLRNAWTLAMAAPPWSLRAAFLGSEAKILSAATPVRVGLDACDAALAGLTGQSELLEHEHGFLNGFAAVAVPEAVVAGLGERWHTDTLSFQFFPCAVQLVSVIECAAELHRQLGPDGLDAVETIDVHAPRITLAMDQHAAAYRDDTATPLPAVNLSIGYNVATALLTGGLTPDDLLPAAIGDQRRWDLARRVRAHYDEGFSRKVMTSTAPVGEALRQAGERAVKWTTGVSGIAMEELMSLLGPPSETFEKATKYIGCRIELGLRDGRRLTVSRDEGLGAVGSSTWCRHPDLVHDKLVATGVADRLATDLRELPWMSAKELGGFLGDVLPFV